jgi:hypothetical protein
MEERVDLNDFKKELKRRERKEKIQKKIDDAKNWVSDNKESILRYGPAVIGGLAVVAKAADRHIKLNKEKDLKELYCYDRSLGHYWKLRRELTNDEWVEIDKRKKNGERLADILDELKVLK